MPKSLEGNRSHHVNEARLQPKVGSPTMGNLTSLLGPSSAFQGAHDITIHGGTFVIGQRNHTHIGPQDNGDSLLNLVPPSNFRSIQMDTFKKATPSTGQWLIDSDYFQAWVKSKQGIIWGIGMPGAGKTVLVSIVIEYLEHLAKESPRVSVGFAYCRYSHSMSVGDVLMALIRQQAERNSFVLDIIGPSFLRHQRENTTPSDEELLGFLQEISKRFDATFHCLDALDEAPKDTRLDLLKALASVNVNLFITSRPLDLLKKSAPGLVFFDIVATDHDVNLFLTQKISGEPAFEALLEMYDIKAEIISAISEKAAGMFLHVSLQFETLRHCCSLKELRAAMKRLPDKVEDMYATTLATMSKQPPNQARIAKLMLIWAIYAERSLTFEELQFALTFCPETQSFDPDDVSAEPFLLSLCGGLVTVDKESQLVRLLHYTAKEPLKSLLANDFPHPHSLIGTACIVRLAECGFQNSNLKTYADLQHSFEMEPLLNYAYEYFGFHAHKCYNPAMSSHATQFVLECHSFPFNDYYYPKPQTPLDSLSPIHVAGLYDFTSVLDIIVQDNFPPSGSASEGGGVSPSHNASRVDVNLATSHGITSLMYAARYGHKNVVEHLLAVPGIDANSKNTWGWTALMHAAKHGQPDIVLLLLAVPGIEANAADQDGWTVLMKASRYGHEKIVQILLAFPGIAVNLVDEDGWTALMKAFRYGHEKVVRLLLSVPGIKVNLADEDGWTALMMASRHGHEGTVRLLLAVPGVEVNLSNREGATALILASRNGHGATVKLLLGAPGIHPNCVDNNGWTPLMWASLGGYHAIVQDLLTCEGVVANAVNNNSEMALDIALRKGHRPVVDLLSTLSLVL